MDCTHTCKRCGQDESVLHVLWSCNFAKKIWEKCPIGRIQFPDGDVSFLEVWRGINKKLCLPPIGLVHTPISAWVCWFLWKDRNKLIFEGRSLSESEILHNSITAAKEWEEAQKFEEEMKPSKQQKPILNLTDRQQEMLYLKTDAAWDSEKRKAGTAAIVVKAGQIMHRVAAVEDSVASPLTAEALAVRSGLLSAIEYGVRKVVVQSDCLTLINAIEKHLMIPEIYGVCLDISNLLLSFDEAYFTFIPRSVNVLADSLAKKTLRDEVVVR